MQNVPTNVQLGLKISQTKSKSKQSNKIWRKSAIPTLIEIREVIQVLLQQIS